MGRILRSLFLVSALVAPAAAQAGTYTGKVWLVQPTSAPDVLRFVTVQGVAGISLHASGPYKDIMLQGFFKKANMDVGYASKPCPPPIPGTCNVVNLSVNTTGF